MLGNVSKTLVRGPYNLSIQVVFLDHHNIDGTSVFECEKSKSSGAARCTITHNCAFLDLSKLGKVVLQRFYIIISTEGWLFGQLHSRSVVSQFNPPMNIFLQKKYTLAQ
jgi:hypothetical protein